MRGIATTLHSLDGAPLVRHVSPKKECSVVLVRYADDVVAGLECQSDAERFLAEIREQAEKFGLSLQPHKRRLIEFGVMRLDIGRGEVLESWKRSPFWVAATPDGPGPDVSQATGREAALSGEYTSRSAAGALAEVGDAGYFTYHIVPTRSQRLNTFHCHVPRFLATNASAASLKDCSTRERVLWG